VIPKVNIHIQDLLDSGDITPVDGGAIDMSKPLADDSGNTIDNNSYKVEGGAVDQSKDVKLNNGVSVSQEAMDPWSNGQITGSASATTPEIDTPVNLPKDKLLHTFAMIESSGKNTGPNKNGYEGIYQFRYRKGDLGSKLAKKLGVTPDYIRKHPELQNKMMEIALEDYKKGLRRHKIPTTPLNLYMVHNQGLGGTLAIHRVLSGKGGLSHNIRRNILNQFGAKEKAVLKNASDKTLVKRYVNKFRNRITKFSS